MNVVAHTATSVHLRRRSSPSGRPGPPPASPDKAAILRRRLRLPDRHAGKARRVASLPRLHCVEQALRSAGARLVSALQQPRRLRSSRRERGRASTALATTAVFATGWPMTPTLPTRAARNGILGSFGCRYVIGLDRGDDRLDGDASVRDQLTARTPGCWCKGRRPDRSRRSGRLPCCRHPSRLRGGMDDVVRSKELDNDIVDGAELVERSCRS